MKANENTPESGSSARGKRHTAKPSTAKTRLLAGGDKKAYECGVRGTAWSRVVTATSAGKAKYQYLRAIQDAWDGVRFMDLTCRAVECLPPTRAELAQREADAFNARHPIGTMLAYWSMLHEGQPTGIAPICHEATVVCESAVIWLEGVSSCHSITHVEAVTAAAVQHA